MDLQIAGDVAVVVGGARGLGRAIAEAFVAEGANAAIVDRDPECVYVARELGGIGIVADVTDDGAIRDAAEEIRRVSGRCDHLIFAAAISPAIPAQIPETV